MGGYWTVVVNGLARDKVLTPEGEALFKSLFYSGAMVKQSCHALNISTHCYRKWRRQFDLARRWTAWSEEETTLLEQMWGEHSLEEISERIGRSVKGCRHRAFTIGLTRERSTSWTTPMVDTLVKLKNEGFSYYYIAKRLGITPNMAIGKGYRLGIKSAPRPPKQTKAQKQTRQRVWRKARKPRITKEVKAAIVANAPASHNLAFSENDGCMWPTEKGFCGHPRAGNRKKPHYCEAHCHA